MNRNKTMILGLNLLLTGLFIAACAPKRSIDAEALNGVVQPVLDRHDAYVAADPTLDSVQKEVYLRSTEQIRATMNEALEITPAPSPAPEPAPSE